MALPSFAQSDKVMFLSKTHCMMRAEVASRYVLLPVEEQSEVSNIKVISDNNVVKTLNVRLAADKVDYYVPLDISKLGGKKVLFDFHVNGVDGKPTAMKDYACWKTFLMPTPLTLPTARSSVLHIITRLHTAG